MIWVGLFLFTEAWDVTKQLPLDVDSVKIHRKFEYSGVVFFVPFIHGLAVYEDWLANKFFQVFFVSIFIFFLGLGFYMDHQIKKEIADHRYVSCFKLHHLADKFHLYTRSRELCETSF